MPPGKWSDAAFLDSLRRLGDPLADGCVQSLKAELERDDFRELFRRWNANETPLPDDVPAPLKAFLAQATTLPRVGGAPVDVDRLERGQRVFMTHASPACLVLLAKALPEGYAAPNLASVLSLSGALQHHPYKRLLGVLQMVVNISAVGGFGRAGKALVTIPKIRLLHAGIRQIVHRHLPGYEARHGTPVNLEDMLATLMGFSYLVIAGLQTLRVGLTDEQAEDFYYLWRLVALMMGIHPAGEPDNDAYVPSTVAEAADFYGSYARRHYVEAAANPDGVALARANLQMLNDLLPQTPLRRLGMQLVPRIYMQVLVGDAAMARVGIAPVRGFVVTKGLLRVLPWLWARLWEHADRLDRSGHAHENLSRIFFQGLIDRGVGGEVTFFIPDRLAELRE